MFLNRLMFATVALAVVIAPLAADSVPVILRGRVVMQDGSPPPKTLGIQRICSDSQGSAPGPLTDKKGEYLWRMEVDPMRTRVCRLEVATAGYASTAVDISGLNGYTNVTQMLPDIIITVRGANPMTIVSGESGVPGKSLGAWKAAIKAIDSGDLPSAAEKLQEAVKASPKFAAGWHTLGIIQQTQQKFAEAKDAYEHALEADPKAPASAVTLARVCIHMKDWVCAAKASESAMQRDTKHMYPEVYLHLSVAKYGQKDLDGALSGVQEAAKMDPSQKRAEYVLGRILEAKGDLAGAREHMNKYLLADPNVADVATVKAHLELLGKPEAATAEPDLELL